MYIVRATELFHEWLNTLDKKVQAIILARISRAKNGNLGDIKHIESDVFEMRFHINSGYRVYYAKRHKTYYLLLNGGNKSTQTKDIKTALKLWSTIKDTL